MPYLDVPPAQIYYEDHAGPDNAETLVFLHGAAGNHISWWQQVPYFSKTYRCLTIDHRGFGWSADPESLGGHKFVEDLNDLLLWLEIDKVSLICQSMGGRTGLGFAVHFPEKVNKLVMGGTWGFFDWSEQLQLAAKLREDTAGLTLEQRAIGDKFKKKNPNGAFLYQQIASLNPPRNQNITSTNNMSPTPESVANLDIPVLAIVGSEDIVIPPPLIKTFADLVPNSQYMEIPDIGHSFYFEDPDQFNRLIETFLAG